MRAPLIETQVRACAAACTRTRPHSRSFTPTHPPPDVGSNMVAVAARPQCLARIPFFFAGASNLRAATPVVAS
eukprot:301576-Pleurochrysis_carterae.AAC.2